MSQRSRFKRKKSHKGFSMLVHEYFTSPQYARLSPGAVKALVDLYTQFRGANNGDLCAAWDLMAPRGWTSKGQLAKALQELLDAEWIVITRMGGNRVARLYAVTWLGIDHCEGKLDVKPNPVPSMLWKTATPPARLRRLRGAAATSAAKTISAPRPAGHSAPPGGSKVAAEVELRPAPRVNGRPFRQSYAPPGGTLYRSMPPGMDVGAALDRWADDGGPAHQPPETPGGAA